MRKTIGLIVAVTMICGGILLSCTKKQTRDDLVRNNAEQYLKENMNDPESYEFVKLELIDSVLYKDNIEYRRQMFENRLENEKKMLTFKEEVRLTSPSMYSDDEINRHKNEISKDERIIAAIDSIEISLGNKVNEVASYTYIFSFRGKNELGAKTINVYYLQTTPDLNVKNLTTEKSKIIVNPSDFPGYLDILNRLSPI
ncbi:MAG: hypothetical protein JW783_08410 [Bacteroidales bacterium]|nr:hypothetical protein [Bacteroidales bacterium]MBN2749964.1 hypothetical protein [Bacteroidales bacterium]